MDKVEIPVSLRSGEEQPSEQGKAQDLSRATSQIGPVMTDNMGHKVSDDQNTLRAGERGPSLLEDFFFREKITHFDHERIPERIVHARGAGAHGYFELHKSLERYTHARVLTEVGVRTPAFVRFSTVAGSRGSMDTARDVRGFAVKLYTEEGNWDIVGNNMPIFFIQDAIKFPDLIHAVKPEPHREIPQAASAHDTFYDFISLTPEATHMLMWVHSDRAIPRSFDMMDGFGIHTFRLINARGESHFVKFHWKAALGAHSLVWDEAQKIGGKDPDFHRRTMWDTIEAGGTLEWDFGVQIFSEEEAQRWDFDVLDPTKIVPEDLVPVEIVGRLVLNRNPENYFAETEQVAFMPTNIVPGLDFTADPLLQGRTFSYLDTQLSRLGSPNWVELPINRPLAPVQNNRRDGHMRHTINPGRVAYYPNGMVQGQPAPSAEAGFSSYPEQMRETKRRARADSFNDHFGQARLFWNSMTPTEREHITKSLAFELSMCELRDIRLRMIELLRQVNETLASQVAFALGEAPLRSETAEPGSQQDSAAEVALLADAISPTSASGELQSTKGLSQLSGQPRSAAGRKVALLAAPGVDAQQVESALQALRAAGAQGEVVGTRLGDLGGVEAKKSLSNADSVLYDAVLVPGGAQSVEALLARPEAATFILESYRHAKPIAAIGQGEKLLEPLSGQLKGAQAAQLGLLTFGDAQLEGFIDALSQHRFWGRPVL